VPRVAKERTLTVRELNRALLARQLLLGRAKLSVPRAVERIGALQAQWPPSPYLALWSRLDDFSRDRLSRAVARRHVVKATLMRATLHIVSARDYLAFAGVVRAARLADLQRRAGECVTADVERLAPQLIELASAEPRSRPELLERLGLPKLRIEDRRPWVVWHLLVVHAELVHSPESSAWRRNTAGGRFVPAPEWLGGNSAEDAASAEHLVRRYLGAFGPASLSDASQWTGLTVATLEPVFARLPLRGFRDGRGRELFDLPRAPLPPAGTGAPVRFLPTWDSSLLAHQDRSRILPDDLRRTVIKNNGDVQQTFLVDGFVAGLWRMEGDQAQLEPFEPLPARARAMVEREARRLERWLAA
jgi:winged helix DNA-binding protein